MELSILIIILILLHFYLIWCIINKCKNESINKIIYRDMFSYKYHQKKISPIRVHHNIQYQGYKKVKNIMFNKIYKVSKTKHENFNIEHIVPQSLYGKDITIKKDMHNLVLYPKNMNRHRSNYKYVDDPKIYDDSILLNEIGNKINYMRPYKSNYSIKNNKLRIFHPKQKYKGEIARACMYFIRVYNWEEIIFKYVIDPYTILLWHHQYPVSKFEKKKNKIILKYQKNENEYISNPQKLVPDMEFLIGVKLNSFKKFQY